MPKAALDSPFKFDRKYRLASKQDIQAVFAKPSKVTRKYLLVLYKPNELGHARLGIIIKKHHINNATDRNRLRRIVRESFRQQKEALKGLDIIVLVRSECTADNKALRDDVDHLWPLLVS